MLNPTELSNQLKEAFENVLPDALSQAMLTMFTNKDDKTKDMCKEFGKAVSDNVAEPLAEQLADAIDYYIKSMVITGSTIAVTPAGPSTPIMVNPTMQGLGSVTATALSKVPTPSILNLSVQ